MGLETLVPVVMGALLRVAGKVGESVLGAVEAEVTESANKVLAKLRSWWSGDDAASEDLKKFESEPDMYSDVVTKRLVKKLTQEPEKQQELEALLNETGPKIEVFQEIAHASGITGAKIEEIIQGHIRVDQKIQNATNVVGVDIKSVGSH